MSLRLPSEMATGLTDWALRTPDRIALWDNSDRLSFAEFDARAGTLARLILEHIADAPLRDSLILPIVVGRDIWSILAIHAAIRAGVAFSALDESHPPAMMHELLQRLGQPDLAIVTGPHRAGLLPSGMRTIDARCTPDRPSPAQPRDPSARAAVVFTSGSTGRPKGVVYDGLFLSAMHQRNLDFYAQNDPLKRMTALSPFSFMGGLVNAVTPSTGPSMLVLDPSQMTPLELLDRIDRESINMVGMVSSLAATVLNRSPAERRIESVTRIVVGGEPFSWDQLPALRQAFNANAEITVAYGASETAGALFLNSIAADTPQRSGPISLGFPVGPGRVRLEPIGDGADGLQQIVVVGAVACEYLDDPELTNARFGTDADGTRWWRSGDLAEQLGDGTYQHLGRIDDLIKIRGKLVEPSEPERVLRQIPGIRNLVVLPHPSPSGGQRLVAHIVLDDESTITPHEVRGQLRTLLPAHLIPALLVQHRALPMTERSKIDRGALLQGDLAPWRTTAARSPAGTMEYFVVAHAAEVLDLDSIDPDDDLWDFGLDSFAAVELAERLSTAGRGAFDPNAFVLHRSCTALAALLTTARPQRRSTITQLNDSGTRSPIFFIPGAHGNAVGFDSVGRALGSEQPVVVIESHGVNAPGRIDRSVLSAAARALKDIARLQPEGTVTVVGYSAGGVVAYEIAQQLTRGSRDVRVVLLDAAMGDEPHGRAGPAELSTGPTRKRGATGSIAALVRRPQIMLRRAAVLGRRVHPGRPTNSPHRRTAIFQITELAIRRYRPEPAAFPVTLLHVDGSEQAARWALLVPHLVTHRVRGTHLTMLEPPHATALAALIGEAVR